MNKKGAFLFSLYFFSSFLAHSSPIEVALTIDDIPGAASIPVSTSRVDVAHRLIKSLQKTGIKGVYAFANGGKSSVIPKQGIILKSWVQAGHFLGNHTLSHLNLNKTDLLAYQQDVEKNETILDQYLTKEKYKYFRFPFLAVGETTEKNKAFRDYLIQRGYKTAQVTIDFKDWAWNDAYSRCADKKNTYSIKWMQHAFLLMAEERLRFAIEQSKRIFNRSIRHILLLHFGAFDALMMDDLIKMFKKMGVIFINLDRALEDPGYQEIPNPLDYEATFLSQIIYERKLEFPPTLKNSVEVLDQACRQ